MPEDSPSQRRQVSKLIDPSVPHPARMWNYWLGGKDHYPIDREAAGRIMAVYPGIVDVARASREFLGRVVRHLTDDVGIRQFLDIGTGLPSADNTHEVAQRAAPESRIVYVDNDPLVLAHARALLTSTPEGVCAYIEADVHDPETILRDAAETLDFSRPIAVVMMGVLGNVRDYDRACEIVRTLMDAMPSGSYLVINDGTDTSEARVAATQRHNQRGSAQYYNRSPEQLAGYLEGLELLEPGVVPTPAWRPESDAEPPRLDAYCGVARKS
ncbi:SAM-dependent methyltransferase [Spirillospora sp. CA-294931]|uniref:SAM-dependent methyltransferase n=1 Tax=Spirillospora sp. CA-294931 TaxID=3240042 RepID=UPI003D91C445